MPARTKAVRKGVRRHRVPLPLTETTERFEGGEILREYAGELALLLWKSYKNSMLWAQVPPGERTALFALGAAAQRRDDVCEAVLDPALTAPLLRLTTLLERPADAAPRQVAAACREVAGWCEGCEASGTALHFTQAAALADPRDAEAALAVAGMARDRGEFARAESWFRQCVVTAREGGDWASYTRAHLGLARVYWQRGALPAARRCVLRAFRTADRHHLHALRGDALAEMGGLCIHVGRWEEAGAHIRAAVELFGPTDPRTRRVIVDTASAWVARGWYAPALRVLSTVANLETAVPAALGLWGTLARAAGGAGDSEALARAADAVQALGADPDGAVAVPHAWLDVAHGAAAGQRWGLAERAAREALATSRGQARVRHAAEAVLDAASVGASGAGRPHPAVPSPVASLAAALAERWSGAVCAPA